MKAMVPRNKMSKKVQRDLDLEKRNYWSVCPVTKIRESGKLYSRKRMKQDLF